MIPSISVIVPAYNRFSMLVPVIDSILNQTVPVTEVLVIDDESQDETAEKIPMLISQRPDWRERVRYIRQNNQGQSAALNRGIEESKGYWLGFSGHDDLWLPWKLEWQFRAISKFGSDCGLCFSDAWFMNNPYMKQPVFQFAKFQSGDRPIGKIEDPVSLVVGRHPIWVQTVIAKKELIQRAGNFDTYLRYSEDHDFLFRMALITHFCYVGMPMVLIDRSPAEIRHSGESKNWHRVEFCLRMDQYRFEKQLEKSKTLSPAIRRTIRQNLRSIHSHWANYYLEMHEYKKACEALRAAISYDITISIVIKRLLTIIMPRLSRAIFVAREDNVKPRHDRTSWQAESSSAK